MQTATPAAPEITARSWGMIAILGLIWGATFMVIELALPGITPAWLAAYRIGSRALKNNVVLKFSSSKTRWQRSI